MSRDDDPDHRKPVPDEPLDPSRRRLLGGLAVLGASWAVAGCDPLQPTRVSSTATPSALDASLRAKVRHIVVIYAENRSFTNLYGHFPGVQMPLDGLPASRFTQLDRDGRTPLAQLPKIWGGLVPAAQEIDGRRYVIDESQITGLPNAPFRLADAGGAPLPNSVVTRDLVHRFYQNQMQIAAGRNNQFAAWGDAGGLVMGHYRNSADSLRLWNIAQRYTLCDNFFMAAFGGSWLNHIYLISAQTPHYPDVHRTPAKKLVAVLEGDDPTGTRLKLAGQLAGLGARRSAEVRERRRDHARRLCGQHDGAAVPAEFRCAARRRRSRARGPANVNVLPPQAYDTIGDRLSAKQIGWAWYAGAWQDALTHHETGAVPNFQYHHQPFNYFVRYAPGTPGRSHLLDGGVGDDPSTNRCWPISTRGGCPP
ncbi:MAG: acid phosphatase [Pararobbsia sp.]